jgi:hypothetical protein
MMLQLLVTLPQPKIKHHTRARGLVTPPPLERLRCPAHCGEQLSMRTHCVGIRDDRAERHDTPVAQLHTGNRAALHHDARHLSACVNLHAEITGELFQRLRHRTRAAEWIPNPVRVLHVTDPAKHRRRSIRRRADYCTK